MTPRLPIALAIIGLVSTGVLSTTLTAKAQETPPKAESVAPGESGPCHFKPSPEDRAAFLDARLAALHAGLELTPDQEKLWPPVEQALRDFSKLVRTQRQQFHEEKRPHDPIARLQLHGDNMIARGQALKKIADAGAPLYAKLTDAQKNRVPILAHAIFHRFMHHGRFAKMGEWQHGMMRRGMMEEHMMGGNEGRDCGMEEQDGD